MVSHIRRRWEVVFDVAAAEGYLEVCRDDSGRLPVFLDGRDYGIVWDSIEKGIVSTQRAFSLVTEEIGQGAIACRRVCPAGGCRYQSRDRQFLLSELYCLGHDTDNTVILASRMQCDRRDFHSDFVYYTIDPVSDDRLSGGLSVMRLQRDDWW